MDAITYSAARATLAKTMDRVCEDHEMVIITRQGGSSVVMISLEDYNSIEETAYLLGNKNNARRLTDSIQRLESGLGIERTLVE